MMGKLFDAKKIAMPALFLILLLQNAAFAQNPDWVVPVSYAILISIFATAAFYAAVTALNMEAFKAIAKDEVFQAIIGAIMVALLLTCIVGMNSWMLKGLCGIMDVDQTCAGYDSDGTQIKLVCPQYAKTGTCPVSITPAQWAIGTNEYLKGNLSTFQMNTVDFSNKVGTESAKSGMVSMLGVGVGIAGCSAYGALRGPAGQLINALGFGLMDLEAEYFLLQLAQGNNGINIVLALLLPAGILLRALHFTRKAGAALISLAICLYFVFPAGVLFGRALADGFATSASQYLGAPKLDVPAVECNPFDPDESELVNVMGDLEKNSLDLVIFWVVVRAFLVTVFAITITFGCTRELAHLLGAEFDVSAIARLS